MTPEPEVKPLSRNHRRFVFFLSIFLFVTVVPLLVFYAIGYRIDLSGETRNIRTVGGMYISADAENISIFVDDEPVEDMRVFQNAAYVQNLDAGLHQVHVQGEGINTWVKMLPVQAHFVVEANSFNLPIIPQVRLITKYETDLGASVVDGTATSGFTFASTTNIFYATSSTATSSYTLDPEYTYLSSIFASTTEERELRRQHQELMSQRFRFQTDTGTTTEKILAATTTKRLGNTVLHEVDGEIIATWIGDDNDIPYYQCVTYAGPSATSIAYGSHVYEDIVDEFASSTDLLSKELIGMRLCRHSIKIDRLRQTVQYFDFVPGREDLVLLQLQDGVYVVEVDDRSWQNAQLLYPGDYLEVIVDGGSIFVQDDDMILEVYLELQA